MPKPLAVVPDVESELDELCGLPPTEFTSARNELARRLKQAGQSAISARVRELRKPTIPLWAVNQLARRHPKEVEALVEAGERLRAAQKEALGGEPEALRPATAAERQALRALTQQAQALLMSEDHAPTAAVLERIASTLRSAAVDPAGRELLAAGRLSEELESAGFAALEGLPMPSRPKRSKTKAKPKEQGPTFDRRREERVRKLRERSSKLARDAANAEREAADAEAAADRARRKAERTRAAAEAASAELETAEGGTPTRQ